MEPTAIGVRLATGVVTPLIRKLFVTEGPGAGLVDRPVRISGHVSFRGEKRRLGRTDVARLAAELVRQALRSGERPLPADEEQAVVHALADTLYALGDLTMTDVQAVELGPEALAARLRAAAGDPARHLSRDASLFLDRLLTTACLHILHFFTQRSAFVPRTLVEQTRRQRELLTKVDALIARTPPPDGPDPAFEQRYLSYVATHHAHLTIYGIDLVDSPDRWPLDAAYLSLTALHPDAADEPAGDPDGQPVASAATTLPADRALAEHDRVLLRGAAGSGKTTLVQWLAVGTGPRRTPRPGPGRPRRPDPVRAPAAHPGPPPRRPARAGRLPGRRPRPLPRHPAGRLGRPGPARRPRAAARRRRRRDPGARTRTDPALAARPAGRLSRQSVAGHLPALRRPRGLARRRRLHGTRPQPHERRRRGRLRHPLAHRRAGRRPRPGGPRRLRALPPRRRPHQAPTSAASPPTR
ncbi:hypothetical protein RKD49_004442 [Streptomyces glaucescens]